MKNTKQQNIILYFNDGYILLPKTSFLYKNSELCKMNKEELYISFELNNNIYDLIEYDTLYYILSLKPNKFIDTCNLLDILQYNNNDVLYAEQFTTYVMNNSINLKCVYFMKNEIDSINNYNYYPIKNIGNINNDYNIIQQIKTCSILFYRRYLKKYIKEILITNRYDIYNSNIHSIYEYYKYVHLYNTPLSNEIKQTKQYSNYIINLNDRFLQDVKDSHYSKIITYINEGAFIMNESTVLTNSDGNTILMIILSNNYINKLQYYDYNTYYIDNSNGKLNTRIERDGTYYYYNVSTFEHIILNLIELIFKESTLTNNDIKKYISVKNKNGFNALFLANKYSKIITYLEEYI